MIVSIPESNFRDTPKTHPNAGDLEMLLVLLQERTEDVIEFLDVLSCRMKVEEQEVSQNIDDEGSDHEPS